MPWQQFTTPLRAPRLELLGSLVKLPLCAISTPSLKASRPDTTGNLPPVLGIFPAYSAPSDWMGALACMIYEMMEASFTDVL